MEATWDGHGGQLLSTAFAASWRSSDIHSGRLNYRVAPRRRMRREQSLEKVWCHPVIANDRRVYKPCSPADARDAFSLAGASHTHTVFPAVCPCAFNEKGRTQPDQQL
ncbi:hypothetical protein MAPG_05070 [Magnaporthiopsis poae ATCC 64411]|uniref:Uncharacterized protein n=1 Tax=Magnaporthiopsis poae (strain ATCC 64411 / 73-15) TaxID=644358 RepID=A0A0C4DYE9_MAGP6|nr:hypothetical protein MAPG_05070 [Magnaporthiopsis poae ATCC 64411]